LEVVSIASLTNNSLCS